MAERRIIRMLARAGALAAALAGSVVLVNWQTRPSGKGQMGTPASARAVRLGFEPKDINARIAALIVLGLGGSAIVLVGAMFGLLWLFATIGRHPNEHLTQQQTAEIQPPLPRLQAHPVADLTALRAHEDAMLNAWAYLDLKHTRARIPIGRAMALMVGRPLDPGP